jgi:hypothetical protein
MNNNPLLVFENLQATPRCWLGLQSTAPVGVDWAVWLASRKDGLAGFAPDFSQQTAEYFLNGVSFGTEPFRDTQSAKGLMGVWLDLVGGPEVGVHYTAAYDKLMVQVVAP